MKRIRFLFIAVTAVLALIAAGCGSGSDDVADTSTTETTTTTTAETTTTTESTTTEPTSSTTTSSPQTTVRVYFSSGDGSDCAQVEAFARSIPADVDPIRAAFDELVAGPTPEETETGVGSFFSDATAGAVSSVVLADGLLVVDLDDVRPLLNNASTSCGSEALLAQLNGTAFQFDGVERVRYQMQGSCSLFANWLQRECFDAYPDGSQKAVPTNEQAESSGCTPSTDDGLPDGRWFGYVEELAADELEFDLACWFTGTAAAAAASEDGEESPPPNDYYVRNQNNLLRTLSVGSEIEVSWLPTAGDPTSLEVVLYDEWRSEQTDRAYTPGVWITIHDGEISSIQEQYVP
ncbi:MAG: GerMN domain-containing protein [Acidimicrobiales bacterium]